VERGTLGVKCLALEHHIMSLARAQTPSAHSGVECTNKKANMPPIELLWGREENKIHVIAKGAFLWGDLDQDQ